MSRRCVCKLHIWCNLIYLNFVPLLATARSVAQYSRTALLYYIFNQRTNPNGLVWVCSFFSLISSYKRMTKSGGILLQLIDIMLLIIAEIIAATAYKGGCRTSILKYKPLGKKEYYAFNLCPLQIGKQRYRAPSRKYQKYGKAQLRLFRPRTARPRPSVIFQAADRK